MGAAVTGPGVTVTGAEVTGAGEAPDAVIGAGAIGAEPMSAGVTDVERATSAQPSAEVSGRARLGRVARRTVRFAVRAPRYVPVLLLRAYRLLISPLYGPTCRFYPSCSAYALEAFEVHGVVRGGYLTVRRLARCHPWNPGGIDPVPPLGRGTRKDQADPSAETRNDAPSTRRAA
jgi:putative membrane protein insertion efficiency factor